MKKPNIQTVYGGDDSPSLFLVKGLHLDVDEIKENYEEMIDALINAHGTLDSLTYCGADRNIVDAELENIEQALKKEGCEFN